MPTPLISIASALKFIAPSYYERQKWQEIDTEVKDILSPIHSDLSQGFISPQDGATQFSESVANYLSSKPDFQAKVKEKEGYFRNNPKSLDEARKLKNTLRKSLKNSDNSDNSDIRKKFQHAVRLHNHLLKQKKQNDIENKRFHQEKMFRDNFWEFSRKLCKGNIDKTEPKPTFSKETADLYYPTTYSTRANFDVSNLNWFPRLHVPDPPILFDMSHVKPKDVKLLKDKKSASVPDIDGLTYGILKHLPSSHHFLATLYSKILLESPKPSPLWQKSKISLIYKRNESDNPKNFRPIALSSIVGKIYHQILSNRILDYLIGNGFIDSSMQKAFINNINGTIEHNQLLQEIISHARVNKRTCHVTFFDLKDAFGSIPHELIEHCLERYKIPNNVKSYIMELYSNISGVVSGNGWFSEEFTFQRGVFQGDPLSPTIFITVFNPLLEYLKSESKHGYKLNNNTNVISTPFADDFNVITSHSRAHQRILKNVERFAKSMNLVLEPTKCKSLSIEFQLSDEKIASISTSPEKFLGSHITFSGKQSEIFSFIKQSIEDILTNIDNSLIREEYKMSIYTRLCHPSSQV